MSNSEPKQNMVIAFIHTIVSRFFLFLIMLVCFIPAVIFLFLVPARYRYDSTLFFAFEHFFYTALLKASFLKITYIGTENIPHDRPVVIASNHQSSLDIPLIGAMLKCFPHIWLASSDLLVSPILRFILPRATVLVDVSTPLKGMKTLIKAIAMINGKRRHVIIFPEGSRYDDGNIHDFYAGFVILAKKTGRPVVPVRLFGANKVYPRGVFIMRNYPITVVVGEPMMYKEGETDESFKDRVYNWFLEQKEP